MDMRYCVKCVMPDTRPGIKFDENGVCFPCLAAEHSKQTNWGEREAEFADLCQQHKVGHINDPYDCVLPASGGKDSHFQLQKLQQYGMRPLIVTVSDWFGHTKTGENNFTSICATADSLIFRQQSGLMREMVRTAFFAEGCPTWPIDAAIYAVPLRIAYLFNLQLIVYGENISHTYGGSDAKETPYANRQNENNVVRPFNSDWWLKHGIRLPEMLTYPPELIVQRTLPIYLSYFFPWSGFANYETATRMGFRDSSREWRRQGCIEDYDQIDSLGYMVHPWLKYPKFGHARATDVASNWIREGRITREQGITLVRENDHKLDPAALDDFLSFTGISSAAFFARVDELYNPEIFKRDTFGNWRFKPGIGL